MKRTKLFLMAVSAVLLLTTFAAADTPGVHPAYLRALTDLRSARAHVAVMTPNVARNAEQQLAIDEIDAAIRELMNAAVNDGKNLNDHPPVDAHLDYAGRLRHALQLLDGAQNDLKEHESDSNAQGMKVRAMHHIDAARTAINHAIEAGSRPTR